MRLIILSLVALVSTSCAALIGERITHFEMASRLEYQGFSFDRPPHSKWYMLRSEQTHTDVTLRRETSSDTHSFYAIVALAKLDREPNSHEDFVDLAGSKGQKAPYPTRNEQVQNSPVLIQNQWCVRVDSTSVQVGAPVAPNQELRLVVRGFRCLHPAWPQTTLDFFYSERGVEDEFDPSLSDEGETFLKGVRIDVAPGTPAA